MVTSAYLGRVAGTGGAARASLSFQPIATRGARVVARARKEGARERRRGTRGRGEAGTRRPTKKGVVVVWDVAVT